MKPAVNCSARSPAAGGAAAVSHVCPRGVCWAI